jgi:membrane protease YdiL (CAAX protease family)
VLLGAALLWAAVEGRSLLFASAAARQRGIVPLRDAAAGLAAGAAIVVLSRLLTQRTRWGAALARRLAVLLGALSLRDCWVLAALSGVAEEAFFRGALQPRVGLVAATLLFGAAHYVPRPGLRAWSLFALAAGAVFGALYQWTGDLIAPALAHVVVNGLNLRWLAERTFVKLSSSRSPRRPPS